MRAWPGRTQGLVGRKTGDALNPKPSGTLEIDEEQADFGIARDVTERQHHAVAVVIGKSEMAVARDPHEPRRTAFVGNGRATTVIDGAEKEQGCGTDEVGFIFGEDIVRHRLEPVGEERAAVFAL